MNEWDNLCITAYNYLWKFIKNYLSCIQKNDNFVSIFK